MSRGLDTISGGGGTSSCPPPVSLTNAAAIALRDAGTLDTCTVYRITDPAADVAFGGEIIFRPLAADEIPVSCHYVRSGLNDGAPFACEYWPELSTSAGRITWMHDAHANNEVKGVTEVLAFPWGNPSVTNSVIEHSTFIYNGGTVKNLRATQSATVQVDAGTVEDVDASRGAIVENLDGILRDSQITNFGKIENKTGGLAHRLTIDTSATLRNQSGGTIEDLRIDLSSVMDYANSLGIVNDFELTSQSDATITDQGAGSRIERSGPFEGLSSLIQTTSGDNNTVWGVRASGSAKVRMSECEGVEASYSNIHSFGSLTINQNGTAGNTSGAGGRFRYLNINSNAGLSFTASQGTLVERVEATSDAYFLCSGNTSFIWRGLQFGSGSRVIMRNGTGMTFEESKIFKEAVIDADNAKDGMYWKHVDMAGGDITADNAGIWLEMVTIDNVGLLNAFNSAVGTTDNRLLEVRIDTGGRLVAVNPNFLGKFTRCTVEDNAQVTINNLKDEVDSGHFKGFAQVTLSQPAGTGNSRGYDLRGSVVYSSAVQDNNVILP